MKQFDITLDKTRNQADVINEYSDQLREYASQILDIGSSLGQMRGNITSVETVLKVISEKVEDEQINTKELSSQLIEIIARYKTAEEEICGHASGSASGLTPGSKNHHTWPDNNIMFRDKILVQLQQLASDPYAAGIIGMFVGMPMGTGLTSLLTLALLPDNARDYIMTALKQAIYGDFVNESNLLGTILSVGIGCTPVGLVADVRDLIADIRNLCDGEVTTEEIVALAFTAAGFIPLLGDGLKHADEAGDALKGLLHFSSYADEAGETVKRLMHKGDDVVSAVKDGIHSFKHNITDTLSDFVDGHAWTSSAKNAAERFKDSIMNNNVYRNADQFLDRFSFTDESMEISAKKIINGIIEEYQDDQIQSWTTKLLDALFHNNNAGSQEPAPAM